MTLHGQPFFSQAGSFGGRQGEKGPRHFVRVLTPPSCGESGSRGQANHKLRRASNKKSLVYSDSGHKA